MNGTLGDTGQDMIICGSRLYVSVYESSAIHVIDLKTSASVKNISVKDDGEQPRGPRYLAAHEGKVYASTHDGYVIRIDTATLEIDAITPVGSNPEGIAAAKGKLYVANSNGLHFPDFHNMLSIVDIATFKETKQITVGLNPNYLAADAYGDVYLSYIGNYGDIPCGMQKIDTETNIVTDLEGVSSGANFTIADDTLYYFNTVYNPDGTTSCTYGRYDVKNEQKVPGEIITDGTKINTACAIGVDPESKDIYIADMNPDQIYVFSPGGILKEKIHAGVLACKFLFFY
jgi:DNA-binding beta-propeller fold protein YncE